jgi:hypothetical protein
MGGDPHERLRNLAEQSEKLGLEGLCNPYDGLTPEDMAYELWNLGYLTIPTVEELVAAIERESAKRAFKN